MINFSEYIYIRIYKRRHQKDGVKNNEMSVTMFYKNVMRLAENMRGTF